MESCVRKSPRWTPSLVIIGSHLVPFLTLPGRVGLKKIKNCKQWDAAQEQKESKRWNFVESCVRKSPWCTPSLVIIGTHLVPFLTLQGRVGLKKIK